MVNSLVKARRDSFKSPKTRGASGLVYDILSEVNRRGGYSNLLLPQALGASNFEQRDKGFATELLYGTLRMQGRHDYILSQVSDRPWNEVDEGIVDICRLGVHQLFEMRVATHAAVSATVELARKVIGESKASFVNAILRKVSAKTLEEWLEPVLAMKDPVSRLSIQYSHPEWIVSAYFDLLKDYARVEEELAANKLMSPENMQRDLTIGTSKSVIEQIKRYEKLGYDEYAFWIDSGMSFKRKKESLERFINEVMPAFN